MAACIKNLVASKIVILFHLLTVTVSAEHSRSAVVTVTTPELQVLQESLNIISREITSLKSKYEENQASLFLSVYDLHTAVTESNVRTNELKQQFDEHRLSVENQLKNIKGVMLQDHTLLKTNSQNVFNKMVDIMVDIRLQHRLQNDVLGVVQSVSENVKTLNTNVLCNDEERDCPVCSDDQRTNKTFIQLPEPTESNILPMDVEAFVPLLPAPDPPVLPPAPRRAPPAYIPPPPPEPPSTIKPTTTKEPDCDHPFFTLETTGECMAVSVTKRTWTDAQASCLRIGAYLAVPEDPRKLHTYVRKAGAHSYYYVGAHNKLGEFRWLNGTTLDPQYWRPHSPSTSYARRLCVAYTKSGSGNKLFWANKATLCDNGLRYHFICEK